MTRPVIINLAAAFAFLFVGIAKMISGPVLFGAIMVAGSVFWFSLAGLLAFRATLPKERIDA